VQIHLINADHCPWIPQPSDLYVFHGLYQFTAETTQSFVTFFRIWVGAGAEGSSWWKPEEVSIFLAG